MVHCIFHYHTIISCILIIIMNDHNKNVHNFASFDKFPKIDDCKNIVLKGDTFYVQLSAFGTLSLEMLDNIITNIIYVGSVYTSISSSMSQDPL